MSDIEINGFEMLEKLGQGGMATVWKARQLSLDRTVAIKILSSRLASDPDDLQRFQQESQSAAKLKHPGIVQVYDANIANGLYFFVMEFIAGYTCADWQRRVGHLAEKDVLLVADCVADALDYAWEREKMIHCDIKPDNVMIDDDGTVKVMDLGLARTISSMTSDVSDEILGTPAYMAPEQAMGEPGLDCRTDMYSLGAMLYHLATGQLPFEGYEVEEVMNRQIKDFLPNPSDLNPSLSRGFCRLVEVLMAKEQAGRPDDWQQVREAIRLVRKGLVPRLKLPEGIASTVLPSQSQDQAASTLSAGASLVAQTLREEEKASKTPFVVIVLLIACVSIAFLVMQSGDGEAPGPAAPTPSPAVGGGQRDAPREIDRGRQLYDRAAAWEKRNPAQIDAAIARYDNVVSEAAGTPYATRAQRDIDRLNAVKREEAISALLASLTREAERRMAEHDYDAAIQTYQAYTGEFEAETGNERLARVAEIKQVQAEWQERERIRIEQESQAKVDALLDEVTRACVDGDFSSALLHVELALADEALSGTADELRGLSAMLKRAVQIDNTIIESFARQAGQQITVDLVSGPQNLLINGARDNVVYASTVIAFRAGTASRPSNFTLKELAVSERVKRMGPEDQAHVNLAKGVMACELNSFDHAKRFFAATDELIASRLIAMVEDRQSRFAAMIPVQAARAEVSRPSSTPVDLPRVVLPDDIAGLVGNPDAVVNRLLADNKSMGSEDILMRRDSEGRVIGIRIRSNEVGDIRALAALRDLRAFELRTLGSRHTAPLADIGPLAGLPLDTVVIAGAAVDNLKPLSGLPLRTLHVPRTGVRDLAPLRGMLLESVDVSDTKVFDFTPLSPMPMKSFAANNSQLRDMGFMRSWQLESLALSDTRVFDFSMLASMPLKYLNVANTQMRRLDILQGCPLEELDISGSAVSDLAPLKNNTATLRRLRADRLKARDFDVLRQLNLDVLSMAETKFNDLRLISHMQLTELSINNTPVDSLDGLDTSRLTHLQLEGTKITSLQPLQGASALRRLFCRNTGIRNFMPIHDSGITHLFVDDPERKSAVFRRLPNLEFVNWVQWFGQ